MKDISDELSNANETTTLSSRKRSNEEKDSKIVNIPKHKKTKGVNKQTRRFTKDSLREKLADKEKTDSKEHDDSKLKNKRKTKLEDRCSKIDAGNTKFKLPRKNTDKIQTVAICKEGMSDNHKIGGICISDKEKKIAKRSLNAVFDKSIMSLRIKNKGYSKDLIRHYFPNHSSLVVEGPYFVLKYDAEDLVNKDMNDATPKRKSEYDSLYLPSKFVLSNISYKETEDTIKTVFEKFAPIEKIALTYNTSNVFSGRAVITFTKAVHFKEEVQMSNRIVRIERIKKQEKNDTRVCLKHINRKLVISELRSFLLGNGYKIRDIRIPLSLESKKNKGYGFIDFRDVEAASRFMDESSKHAGYIGEGFTAEFSKEKAMNERKKHNTFVSRKKKNKTY